MVQLAPPDSTWTRYTEPKMRKSRSSVFAVVSGGNPVTRSVTTGM